MQFGFNRFDMSSVKAFAAGVARGEALGFDIAMIPSSPLLARDPYVMLAQAAMATRTIHLAPMLENPVTRHPAVIAGSIATLAELSNGRAELALGVGDTAVRTLGLKPARVARLEAAVRTIRDLVHGERVQFGEVTSRLRHASPVPVWVAAGGPKTLKMAGKLADGVIIRVGTHADNIDFAIQQVLEGAAEAGRSASDIRFAAVFHTVMTSDTTVVAKIGRAIATGYYEYAPYLFERAGVAWAGPDVESLREQVWQDFHHTPDLLVAGELVDFLPDAAVERFCLHGTGEEIRVQLQSICDRHPRISLVVPHPMMPPGDQAHLTFMETFAGEVMKGW